ncbi:winged helix-turn-helix transcriptional regulator [Sciscionella marina]|uniref:winged helix-turn-helix transcriptional regulator n=1 Tax=Sciscionella marina TaxID=508770 RepID=UPI00047609DB|nr:helix-turn-helix domain-containing protein [Sciscionella marina]
MGTRDEPTVLPTGGPNALGRALGLLGDEWTVLILQRALLGTTRYTHFLDQLPISNSVLTSRLSTLVTEGLLAHYVYQRNPIRAEYRPTERGRSVWSILLAIWDWERNWVPRQKASLPTMTHTVCGLPFRPLLACSSCEKPVEPRDVDTQWGPSGSWARSSPEAITRRRSGRQAEASFFPETMAIFGNRWSSAMIGAAFLGLHRFSEFESALGAPPSLVAERLQLLTEQGVLTPARNDKRTDWVAYRLTEKGRAFFPVIMLLLAWAERWYHAPEGPALVQVHAECQQEFRAILNCDQCGHRVRGRDVQPSTAELHRD